MIKFGTGGWRATIGEDFIRENVVRVAYGISKLAKLENKTDKPIMVGYDRRFLSPEAARWIVEVLCKAGLRVYVMKRSAPTPLVMHTVLKRGLHYGIEVTASHNPSAYNGIKLITDEGRDACVETTDLLEKLINESDEPVPFMPMEECVESGLLEYPETPFNDFIDSILGMLDTDVIRKKGPRILFDPMHGSGTYPLMVILHTARCTIDLINGNRDAYFGGISPAPSHNSLRELMSNVTKGDYDLGIAVDGDGDRLGIIDRDGNYIGANEILVMLYYYLHEYKGWLGPVVRNLSTTHMLDVIAEDFGEKCYEVPVGFKYISAKIDETNAVLGGESSGGLTVRGHIHGKDSIYSASLFIEMFSAIGKTPSEFYGELKAKYGTFEMVEDNLVFKAEAKDSLNTVMNDKNDIPDFNNKIEKISYEDGVKVYFSDNSFIISRFSGTEPLLRIFAEASTKEKAREYIHCMKSFLRERVSNAF